jgi:Uma2 family endonuclease
MPGAMDEDRGFTISGYFQLVEYWIVNLRDDVLEVRRRPDRETRVYASLEQLESGDLVKLVALPGARVLVKDLLPTSRG